MNKKPSWIRKRERVLTLFLVLLLIMAGIGFLIGKKNESLLENKLSELKARGVPLSSEEFRAKHAAANAPKPSSAPKLTTSGLYASPAFQRLAEPSSSGQGLPNNIVELAQNALREFADLLAAAHARIRRPDGSIDFDALRDISGWFDAQGNAGILFLAEALTKAPQNNPQEVYEALLLGIQLSWSYPDSSDAILSILRQGLFTDDELQQLEKLVSELHPDETAWLENRRICGLDALSSTTAFLQRNSASSLDKYVPGATKFLLNAGELVGYSSQQKIRFIDEMDKIQACCELPRPQGVAQMRPLANGLYKALVPSTANQMLYPPVSGFANQVIHEARINAMTASVALERYRRSNGQYPAQWADLVPDYLAEPPNDPCQGGPLRYRPSGNGYSIYTIGFDQDDDRGTHQDNLRSLWQDGDYILIDTNR